MFDLRLASTIMVAVVAVVAVMLIGDYVGYKAGRMKLLTYSLFTVLGLVIVFAIFAIVRSFIINA